MKTEEKKPEERLYEIAAGQQGYFTAAQAIAAGYQINNHPYHVQRRHWIREYRGIFRLALFPEEYEGHYVLWSLWSSNRRGEPQGVYSHQTALSMDEVSDVMPAKLHMTVPKSFRRSAEIPSVLVLHRGDLHPKDIREMRGFRMTTPARTLVDVIEAGEIEDTFIYQAVDEFNRRGLLTRKECLSVIEKHPALAKYFWRENRQKQKA